MSNGHEGFSKDLPTDILVEILSRLPLKSFHRFKTVSKSWLALSSNPYYSKKFRKFRPAGLYSKLEDMSGHGSSVTHFASLSRGHPLLDASMTNFPHRNDCDLELLDCCNGLLLFRCQTGDPPSFYISNPFTKKWISISTPTTYHGRFVLVYDPSISPCFQVLLFETSKEDNTVTSLSVMSSDKGQWKRIDASLPKHEAIIHANCENAGSILLDGTLYLLVCKRILAVKLKGWSCYMIQLPDITPTSNNRIGKCEGKMQYISSTSSMIQIWSLELQSKEGWIMEYKLDLQQLFVNYIQSMNVHPRVIEVHPDHDMIFLFCWKDENTRAIVSYDFGNGEMEEICIFQNKFEKCTFYYVPSSSDDISMKISTLKLWQLTSFEFKGLSSVSLS